MFSIFASYSSLIISIFALLISILTFYSTYSSSFKLKIISVTRVLFTKGGMSFDGKTYDYPILEAGFVFINTGAQGGTIRNLKLELINNNNKYRFYPISEIKCIKTFEEKEKTTENIVDQVGSFYMPGKSEVKKIFAFGQTSKVTLYIDYSDHQNLLKMFPAGKYIVTIAVLLNNDKNWKEIVKYSFTLKENFEVKTNRRELFFDQFVNELLQ
jgi:hypothetical protein